MIPFALQSTLATFVTIDNLAGTGHLDPTPADGLVQFEVAGVTTPVHWMKFEVIDGYKFKLVEWRDGTTGSQGGSGGLFVGQGAFGAFVGGEKGDPNVSMDTLFPSW